MATYPPQYGPPPPMQPNGHPQPPKPSQHTLQESFYQNAKDTWLHLGRAAERIGLNNEAINSYHQVLRYEKLNVPALRGVSSILRSEDKYHDAVEYIRAILAAVPHDGESWSSLGHCYLMMDELQQAYSAYQSALYNLADPKEPKLWYGIGILYDRYGSLEHAEEAFSQVMRMAPHFDKANEIYFRLGIIYKQQAKYDESLECFKYIVATPPTPLNQTDIWFQIGHVYEQQKKSDEAKSAYHEVLKRDPKHAKVLQQLGWLHHQHSADYQSQDQAIEYLEQSVSSDQTDAQSWYLLGRCYMSQHKFPKAYEAYQQAVYRDGRNPTFWCSIGVLYYQINQYRDALDAYSRAIRLNPAISEVWYDLGTLYESCNNQTTDALDAYQRAADLDPTNNAIKTRLQLLRSGGATAHQSGAAAPMPQDVPPSAYQPTGAASGPQQGSWAAAPATSQANQPPIPGPPPLQGREWGPRPGEPLHAQAPPPAPYPHQQPQHAHQAPPPPPLPAGYDQREAPRYQPQHPPPQRQLTPQPPPYQGHSMYRQPERRPASPSPKTRPTILDHSRAPSQPLGPHHQSTPSRITNPNYGGQQIPPPTPSGGPVPPTHHMPSSLYRNTTPPIPSRPPHEARPRSPRSYYQHPSPYPPHGEPQSMSSIASGAPAPLSASTLADAAARDRERENGVHSKRPREWDSREDLYGSNHKKNASEENRSRLEDPYSRRFQSPPTVMQPERERREYERPPYGENSAPTNSYASPRPPNEGDLRRANEDYKPSAVAHQPAPLSTVLHQEQPQPPREPARPTLPPMNAQQPNGIESNAAKTEQPEPERMEVEEETKPSTEAPRQPEEPAARNMEVDENYDDDSTEESKPLAGGSGRESRASQRSAKEPVSASSNPQPEPTSATAGA